MHWSAHEPLSPPSASILALGGLIGAGLLVGSGTAILIAGRWILLSYLAAGLLLLFMTRQLTQIKRRVPEAALITDFVYLGLGRNCGSAAARLYGAFWILLLSIEALAAANILLPDHDRLTFLAAFMVLAAVGVLGQRSAAWLGEFEVEFSWIKVLAMVVLITILASSRLTHMAQPPPGTLSHWPGPGHALPGVIVAIFSLSGFELIHARTPAPPERLLDRPWILFSVRVFGLYFISITVVLAVINWEHLRPGFSPFSAVLRQLGDTDSARWLSIVILMAVISTINSALTILPRLKWIDGVRPPASHRPARPRIFALTGSAVVLLVAAARPAEAYAFLVVLASVLLVAVYVLFALSASLLLHPNRQSTRWTGYCVAVALSLAIASLAWIAGLRAPLSVAAVAAILVFGRGWLRSG
jgi:L-asparagine transporter-like permease